MPSGVSLIRRLIRWQAVTMVVTWLLLLIWLVFQMSVVENGDLDRRLVSFSATLAETAAGASPRPGEMATRLEAASVCSCEASSRHSTAWIRIPPPTRSSTRATRSSTGHHLRRPSRGCRRLDSPTSGIGASISDSLARTATMDRSRSSSPNPTRCVGRLFCRSSASSADPSSSRCSFPSAFCGGPRGAHFRRSVSSHRKSPTARKGI